MDVAIALRRLCARCMFDGKPLNSLTNSSASPLSETWISFRSCQLHSGKNACFAASPQAV